MLLAAAAPDAPDLWRALASPVRRRLLDRLRGGPATTSALAGELPELSRFAVMQHLGVLTDAGVVVVERRGRDRVNHLNAVPLREWYERWVQPMADAGSAELLAFRRAVERDEGDMTNATDVIRTVRLAFDLPIAATAERTFTVMTERVLDWYPHTYGGERTQAVVVEPQVGGRHYEDWGDGAGHLFGHVTLYDPPRRWATRGRLSPGTILDTEYELTEVGTGVVVHVAKVAVGPMSEDEAAGIAQYGDLRPYAAAIEQLAAGYVAIHLEAYQLILLRRPADPTEYDDETGDRIQREHLAFYAGLRRSGQVLTNGPFGDQPDDTLRGLAFYTSATVEEARELAQTDPAVQAGRLEVEAMTYFCPPGTMIGPGRPVTFED